MCLKNQTQKDVMLISIQLQAACHNTKRAYGNYIHYEYAFKSVNNFLNQSSVAKYKC